LASTNSSTKSNITRLIVRAQCQNAFSQIDNDEHDALASHHESPSGIYHFAEGSGFCGAQLTGCLKIGVHSKAPRHDISYVYTGSCVGPKGERHRITVNILDQPTKSVGVCMQQAGSVFTVAKPPDLMILVAEKRPDQRIIDTSPQRHTVTKK
jgi:hypothetical protein